MDALLAEISRTAIDPGLRYLPVYADSPRARVILLAIGLQESNLVDRWQVVDRRQPQLKGPARGLWQFELGGVKGVYKHRASRALLQDLARARNCIHDPREIWLQLERDDVLAAGVARLLLLTDPFRLPSIDDAAGSWHLYAERLWRPGQPHPEDWPANHARARDFVFSTRSA